MVAEEKEMVTTKRMFIATVLGLLLGVVEWQVAKASGTASIPWSGVCTIILGRAVLGFAIGVSASKMTWWLNGLVLGFIFSLPPAFGALWVGMKWAPGFVAAIVSGLIIGFLIELITTAGFKAKVAVAPA
jgi:hypothetical protein